MNSNEGGDGAASCSDAPTMPLTVTRASWFGFWAGCAGRAQSFVNGGAPDSAKQRQATLFHQELSNGCAPGLECASVAVRSARPREIPSSQRSQVLI